MHKKNYIVETDDNSTLLTMSELYILLKDANRLKTYFEIRSNPTIAQAFTTTINGTITSIFHVDSYASEYSREHEKAHRMIQSVRKNKNAYYDGDEFIVDEICYRKFGKAYYEHLKTLRQVLIDAGDAELDELDRRLEVLSAL